MRVLIWTDGSRGDVQPFVALAHGLMASGHHVQLHAPASAARLTESYGVPLQPLDDTTRRLMTRRDAPFMADRGAERLRLAFGLARTYPALVAGRLRELARASDKDTDVLVHSTNVPGSHIAEWLGVPSVPAFTFPTWIPTTSFAEPTLPFRVPASLNRLSYPLARLLPSNLIPGMAIRRAIDQVRRDTLELPARDGRHDILRSADGRPATVLQAFTRHLLPTPLDYPEWVRTTGFWLLPAPPAWQPPADLAHFLSRGDPPVYVGFGSMVGPDPAATTRLVAEAIRRAGVRAVVATGWGGLQRTGFGDDVYCLDDAPFDWLFPHVAAIVHHGGGTVGPALHSGKPQVICPFILDQPFTAQRLHAIGAAPPPLPQAHLTAGRLAAAIREATTNPDLARRAQRVGDDARHEAGVAAAIDVLESLTEVARRP